MNTRSAATLDGGLCAIAEAVDQTPGSSFPITLAVGGSWLTGKIIGTREWAERCAEVVKPASSSVARALSKMGQMLRPTADERTFLPELVVFPEDQSSGFVHFLGADTLGNLPSSPMRIPLAAVDAWAPGVVQRTESPS